MRPSPTPRPSHASTGPGQLLHSASPDPSVAAPAPLTVIAAIPARYGSTRLPGKPLLPIAGRPMIEHVYRRVGLARGLARIVVLTDDERIARAVEAFGGEVEMTPADCASGTDRIAHAARRWPATAAVVNVQGDEPLIDPEAVSAIAAHLAAHPEDPVVTLAAPLAGGPAQTAAAEKELANPNVVKVVLGASGHALYFSRAAIPYARQQDGAPAPAGAAGSPGAGLGAAPLRHLGIYGYQRAALLRLAGLPPTPLERTEALEQLRALEHGIPIRVLVRARSQPGVDTREDLERVERWIEEAAGAMAPLAAD